TQITSGKLDDETLLGIINAAEQMLSVSRISEDPSLISETPFTDSINPLHGSVKHLVDIDESIEIDSLLDGSAAVLSEGPPGEPPVAPPGEPAAGFSNREGADTTGNPNGRV